MGSSAPPPPQPMDPNAVASTQQTYNLQTGEAAQAGSAVNQQTPFGSLTYQQTGTGPGGVPLYTASTSLSPQQQQILNTLQGQTNATLGGANYGAQNPSDVVGNATSGLTKTLLGQETSYLNPYFTTQTQQLDTQLRNQGLFPSPTANPSDPSTWGPYERQMNQLQQNQNQSVTGYLAQAEPAAFSQSMSNYLLPLSLATSEIGLMHPGTVPSSLAQTPGLSLQPANYTGAVANYQNMQQQTYQDQLQQQQAMMSGLFGIPTAVLGGWAKGGFPGASGLGSIFGGGGAAAGGADLGSAVASSALDLMAL